MENLFHDVSIYEVLDDDDRFLRVYEIDGGWHSAIYLDYDLRYELVFPYSRYAVEVFSERQIHTALLLGGGMYTIPMHIHKYHPEVEMDVIEIDESTLQIAKDFFYYKDCDQIHIHFGDAMHYINQARKKYDFIFCDVYDGIYIPEAFLNLSTIQIIHTLLHKDGIYAINIPGPLQYTKQSELYSFVKKVKSIFSHVYLKAAISPNQKTKFINYVLYASDAPLTLSNLIEDQG